MKKTFITTMPDKVGAFLKAGKCFAALGINITRTSYNKAVDMHTLFIQAESTEENLEKAEEKLREIGFLREEKEEAHLTILEFNLKDKPGEVVRVLELIKEFGFNISYINSKETGSGYQPFKIGFIANGEDGLGAFVKQAQNICDVRTINYDKTEINYDNTIFYNSFAEGLAKLAGLPPEAKRKLAINTNMAMQTLDDYGEPAFTTFDCIRRFAEHIVKHKGTEFDTRITWHTVTQKTDLIIIEPPCGSNTMIFRSGGRYLYIDTGYSCYEEEMKSIFRRLFPDFDTAPKEVILTHSDLDHCGLVHMFSKVYLSRESFESMKNEYHGAEGIREQNPNHKPYCRICKLLTAYEPPTTDNMHIISAKSDHELIEKTGVFDFEDMHFTIYEGAGGHVPGEIIIAEHEKRICFTGDIFINVHDMIPQQKKYNTYAPILMTSVDMNPTLAAKERMQIKKMFAGYKIIGSHGGIYQG